MLGPLEVVKIPPNVVEAEGPRSNLLPYSDA